MLKKSIKKEALKAKKIAEDSNPRSSDSKHVDKQGVYGVKLNNRALGS